MTTKQAKVYHYLITDSPTLTDAFNSIKDYVIISNYSLLYQVPAFAELSDTDIKAILTAIIKHY